MKKIAVLFILMNCFKIGFSQDTIFKRNKEIVIAKILEISDSEVKYKRFDLPEGPDYIEIKSNIAIIKYSNGLTESFQAAPAQVTAPVANQNTLPFPFNPQRITYLGLNRWEQMGRILNEEQMHVALWETKDKDILRLSKQSKFAKKAQFVGFATIPCGIAGISIAAAGVNNLFNGGPSNDNYLFGTMVCAALALSTNIFGVTMFHTHRRKNAQAIELYNQLYRQ